MKKQSGKRKRHNIEPVEKLNPSDFPKFSKDWFNAHSKNDNEEFVEHIFILLCFLVMLISAFWHPIHTKYYYRFHGGVFIASILYMLWVVVARSFFYDIWLGFLKILKGQDFELKDVSRSIGFVGAILSVICLLFVIDTSFFGNNGLRIGGVILLSLFGILRDVASTFRRSKNPK